MKHLLPFAFFCLVTLNTYAQQPLHFSGVSIEAFYGLNGNFFVRGYDEDRGPNDQVFLKKNFIGTISGLEIKKKFRRSAIGLGYARSINKREINFSAVLNSVPIVITNFNIRHINDFFQVYYQRYLSQGDNGFAADLGLLYLRSNQQELEISKSPNEALFQERNYKTYKLEEGGVFVGLQYSWKIDTKFDLGLKSRLYYLVSTSAFEAVTLTPTLSYHF